MRVRISSGSIDVIKSMNKSLKLSHILEKIKGVLCNTRNIISFRNVADSTGSQSARNKHSCYYIVAWSEWAKGDFTRSPLATKRMGSTMTWEAAKPETARKTESGWLRERVYLVHCFIYPARRPVSRFFFVPSDIILVPVTRLPVRRLGSTKDSLLGGAIYHLQP